MLNRKSKSKRGAPRYRTPPKPSPIESQRMALRAEARTQLSLAMSADRQGDAEAAETHRENARKLEARANARNPFEAANDN